MFPRFSTVFRYIVLVVLVCALSTMIVQLGTNNVVDDDDDIIVPVDATDVFSEERRDFMMSFSKHSSKATTTVNEIRTTDTMSKSSLRRKDITENSGGFEYRINPQNLCAGQDVYLITYVHSAPANFKKRQTIRETWAHHLFLKRHKAKVVFIMGLVSETSVMSLVDMESDRYGDIVQEGFYDSYRNLTYKAIAGIRWVSTFCANATFILKTDDDILVNFHIFFDFIKNTVEKGYGRKKLIVCNQWIRMKVMRDKRSKWYIPKEEFPDDFFPPYCSGSAYLMSADVVHGMYRISKTTPFFWVDDYYITGMLVQKLNLTYRRYNEAYILNPGVVEEKFKNDPNNNLVFFHVHKLRTMYELWRNMTLKHIEKNAIPKTIKNVSLKNLITT